MWKVFTLDSISVSNAARASQLSVEVAVSDKEDDEEAGDENDDEIDVFEVVPEATVVPAGFCVP
jgi:hypothetical protein